MTTLSLWEPWATLMAIDAKRYETRSWHTPYRGPLLIHAAKKWDVELNDLCDKEPFRTALRAAGYERGPQFRYTLPLGYLLGVVDLVDCRRTDDVRRGLSDRERAFGDYGPGRFAWKTQNVRRFAQPIPCVGSQGLFALTAERNKVDLAAVRAAVNGSPLPVAAVAESPVIAPAPTVAGAVQGELFPRMDRRVV